MNEGAPLISRHTKLMQYDAIGYILSDHKTNRPIHKSKQLPKEKLAGLSEILTTTL